MKKSIFKSKTAWVNLLMAISIILPELVDLGFHIPAKWMGLTVLVVNLILRFMTTEGVALTDQKK